jgi:ferric-dicitrate binding protein FerR (iron transport regulator)
MMEERTAHLIRLYFQNAITESQKEELAKRIGELTDEQIQTLLEKAWVDYTPEASIPDDISKNIIGNIFKQPVEEMTENITPVIPIHRRKRWLRLTAAAACILLISAGIYLWPATEKKEIIVKKELPAQRKLEDVNAGGQKAVLVLADGSQILLDSANSGVLAQQGDAQITKRSDGAIAYTINGNSNTGALYNTISTPAGGIYQLVLPDGTKAWLNSLSSIRYPTEFATADRRVQISGEVYFEVAKNPAQPFIVKVNDLTEVKVLGTHFNVNAYKDEAEIKTTLLEGSVNISMGNKNVLLTPGQAANINKQGNIKRINDADLEEAIAWKNGNFLFNSAGLADIMRQVSRWYSLEIVYDGKIPEDRFSGRVSRSVNLSNFLKWMQWSDVHFKLEGEKLIIKP